MLTNNVDAPHGLTNGAMATVPHIVMEKYNIRESKSIEAILVYFNSAQVGMAAIY